MRISPSSDVTLYVSPTGSDTAGNGTLAAPFATPQRAADELYEHYDLQNKYCATIQLEVAPPGVANIYPGLNISGRLMGQGGATPYQAVGAGVPSWKIGTYLPFTLQGDITGTNPIGAFVSPGGDRPVTPGIGLTDGAALRVRGITFDNTNSERDIFDVLRGSMLEMGEGITFGNAGAPTGNSVCNHITVSMQSVLWIQSHYTVGGAACAHILVNDGSSVNYNNNGAADLPMTVTVTANAWKFPMGFVWVQGSTMYAQKVTFNAEAMPIGPRAVVCGNGVIFTGHSANPSPGANTGNPTLFPGTEPVIVGDNSIYK